MAKKNREDIVLENIARIVGLMDGMTLAPGEKRKTKLSRKESIAIAIGLAAGMDVGAHAMADEEIQDNLGLGEKMSKHDALDITTAIYMRMLKAYPKRRDHKLSLTGDEDGVRRTDIFVRR